MENGPFEDVFPIENGDTFEDVFPIKHRNITMAHGSLPEGNG